MSTVLDAPPATFTAHDRCDSCGAAAATRVTFIDSGFDLQFCGHHFNKHEAELSVKPVHIVHNPSS